MRKYNIILCLFIHVFLIGNSQDLEEIPLSKSESNKDVVHHYQWESTSNHVAVSNLILFKNKTYAYQFGSNIRNTFSKGTWHIQNNVLTLSSDLQKDNLPVTVSYRQRDNFEDEGHTKIALIKDLIGNPAEYALVKVNNDSTLCSYGDRFCFPELKSIDSLKVVLENGIQSKWINIPPSTGASQILQIILQSATSLERYEIFANRRYKIEKAVLKQID